MGQRGFAPAPVALKILKGETRPSRLKSSPGPQDPPAKPDLSPDASAVWDRVMAATADTAHIGRAHADAFRQFCETTATLNAMQPKGSKEWRELVLISLRLARELCLTPATSGNLSKSTTPERKLDKYLTG